MSRTEIRWTVPNDAMGPLLEEAVREMNRQGPFEVDDVEVLRAPRWVTLVGGFFEVMSPAYSNHDLFAADIMVLLRNIVGRRGLVFNPAAVRTQGNKTLRSADVALYLGVDREEFTKERTFTHRVPHLIVEVLSEDTERVDRHDKKAEYAEIGVKEYYLFDWRKRTCEAFVLRLGQYYPMKLGRRGFLSELLRKSWNPLKILPRSL